MRKPHLLRSFGIYGRHSCSHGQSAAAPAPCAPVGARVCWRSGSVPAALCDLALLLAFHPIAPVAEKVRLVLRKVIDRRRPLILSCDLSQANYCNIAVVPLTVVESLREPSNGLTTAGVSQRLSCASPDLEIR